jgi:predicted phosphodiesterase
MIIAICGDVHGYISETFSLCRNWQVRNQKIIDLILQVGDMEAHLDNPLYRGNTRKPGRMKKMQFKSYHTGSKEVSAFFRKRKNPYESISSKLVFIRGNHDDSEFLHSIDSPEKDSLVSVDQFEKLYWLKDGYSFTVNDEKSSLKVCGIGGINIDSRPEKANKNPNILISSQSIELALKEVNVDILLSHDYPAFLFDKGSIELEYLVKELQPKFHFYGHRSKWSEKNIDGTHFYGLEKVSYDSFNRMNSKCLAILDTEKNEVKPAFYGQPMCMAKI